MVHKDWWYRDYPNNMWQRNAREMTDVQLTVARQMIRDLILEAQGHLLLAVWAVEDERDELPLRRDVDDPEIVMEVSEPNSEDDDYDNPESQAEATTGWNIGPVYHYPCLGRTLMRRIPQIQQRLAALRHDLALIEAELVRRREAEIAMAGMDLAGTGRPRLARELSKTQYRVR